MKLRREGFDPAKVVMPSGRFLLVFHNKSGLEDITLRLDHENGGRVREERVSKRGARWREVFDPPPGRYVLSIAERPEWTCRITITPR